MIHLHAQPTFPLVVPVSSATSAEVLADRLGHVLASDAPAVALPFRAEAGAVWPLATPRGLVLMVGLGATPDAASVYKTLRTFSVKHARDLAEETGLWVDPSLTTGSIPQDRPVTAGTASVARLTDARAMVETCVMGLWAGTYRVKQGDAHPLATLALGHAPDVSPAGWREAAERGVIFAEAQKVAMVWTNLPPNELTPAIFAEQAEQTLAGCTVEVYHEEWIHAQGMGLLEAVNRASDHPARFVVVRYVGPGAEEAPHLGLVGKGVTFDSGGLSIKPSEGMVWMKCDMGGAATVLAATQAIARLQLPLRVTTVVPLAENMVDARAVRPGDVVRAYTGKTVEIADTDAEGRLILADALGWMVAQTDVHHIIDVATLTGAAMRTLGTQAGALFCTHPALETLLLDAAQQTGERLWPLPLWDGYAPDLHSDIADLRNFSGKPTAGSISAAKFLEAFVSPHPSWAHLDVAGMVFGDTEFGKMKTATGYGVRLLVHVAEHLAAAG